MRVDGEQMWTLLRSLDDPDHLEFPAGYDHARTRRRFDDRVGRLDAAFACQCSADRQVQDAGLHARLEVPAEATDTGDTLVIVPEAPLWSEYKGASAIREPGHRRGATWWTRFFDYL